MKTLQKIASFLQQHHVLTLATTSQNLLSCCNLFYVYIPQEKSFIVASSEDTLHIQNILQNSAVAGSVVLETKKVGKIQGLQFRGEFKKLEQQELKKEYFKAFPYALALNPTLWQIELTYMKFTDNRLGFGKKLIWP